ncbi:hypothetical protein Pan54_16350 [Rubinisphaera italica]|uniref:Uncharacterized protein n=1 Tax=Rubinisphaera italica TaxID=2527969 RepID=A0A5C5XEX8_9PLAN|nr:hypothetical protein Pan54_16350 [Rubinisphaera italica]
MLKPSLLFSTSSLEVCVAKKIQGSEFSQDLETLQPGLIGNQTFTITRAVKEQISVSCRLPLLLPDEKWGVLLVGRLSRIPSGNNSGHNVRNVHTISRLSRFLIRQRHVEKMPRYVVAITILPGSAVTHPLKQPYALYFLLQW